MFLKALVANNSESFHKLKYTCLNIQDAKNAGNGEQEK